jgi:hypothetical protein
MRSMSDLAIFLPTYQMVSFYLQKSHETTYERAFSTNSQYWARESARFLGTPTDKHVSVYEKTKTYSAR